MDKKYDGKTLICRTTCNGKSIAGRVSFSQKSISAKLVGFEDFVYFNREDDITLQLEDNYFCTVKSVSTSVGATSNALSGIHHLEITVRQAIIGFRPWNSGDLVQEFQFFLSDTNGFLIAPDVQKTIASANFESEPKSKIFSVESDGTTVEVSFSYSRNWYSGNCDVNGVVGNVSFDEAKTIDEMSTLIGVLRTFFTMAAGVEVWLSDYLIAPKEDNQQPLMGAGSSKAYFQLIWPSENADKPVAFFDG